MLATRQEIVCKTFHGLEQVLAGELEQLGAEEVKVGNRVTTCAGNQALVYRINLQARTALSVLVPIRTGVTKNESQLYELVRSIQWDQIFTIRKTFMIDMVCYSPLFRNSHFLTLKCKDAIVDQFRDKYGKRPSVSKSPDVKINVLIRGEECTISLDTSGASLFKRGYRLHRGLAPINEVLAAGLIHLTGWRGQKPLVDPMTGSGTIPIEARLMADAIAPTFVREDFSLLHYRSFDAGIWKREKSKVPSAAYPSGSEIVGMDIDRTVLRKARANAGHAGLDGITWKRKDFFEWRPKGPPGVLLFNPPYDERMALSDAVDYYASIGDQLKRHCTGWEAWIISSHLQAIKRVGLRPASKTTLFNGPLECRLVKFELY